MKFDHMNKKYDIEKISNLPNENHGDDRNRNSA